MKKLIYYHLPHDLEYERKLLEQWKITGLELVCVPEGGLDECREGQGMVVKGTFIGRKELEALPQLEGVGVESIGYDNLDEEAFREKGLFIVNTPGFCAEDVALHTAGLLLDLVRHITYYNQKLLREGFFCSKDRLPFRLSGKTAGLLGFGSIPQKLAPILQSMGLSVLVWGTKKSREQLEPFGVKKEENLKSLLERADLVSLHLPLTESTRHILGKRELAFMKPSALLLNTSRGGLIEEPALVDALKAGRIAGAGVDVFEKEKTGESELFSLGNVIATPHMAFLSEESGYEARKMVLRGMAEKLGVTGSF